MEDNALSHYIRAKWDKVIRRFANADLSFLSINRLLKKVFYKYVRSTQSLILANKELKKPSDNVYHGF